MFLSYVTKRGYLYELLKDYLDFNFCHYSLSSGSIGLDFSMGTSDGMNGASESLRLNAGVDNAFASSTVASPEYYSTNTKVEGAGETGLQSDF